MIEAITISSEAIFLVIFWVSRNSFICVNLLDLRVNAFLRVRAGFMRHSMLVVGHVVDRRFRVREASGAERHCVVEDEDAAPKRSLGAKQK